jgi:hypothetical protein
VELDDGALVVEVDRVNVDFAPVSVSIDEGIAEDSYVMTSILSGHFRRLESKLHPGRPSSRRNRATTRQPARRRRALHLEDQPVGIEAPAPLSRSRSCCSCSPGPAAVEFGPTRGGDPS